jgi:hypothetical protein
VGVESKPFTPAGASLLTYRATIPGLSTAHLRHPSALLRGHRVAIGCQWRELTPARQALLVLAHLRCGDTFAQLAGSFEVKSDFLLVGVE